MACSPRQAPPAGRSARRGTRQRRRPWQELLRIDDPKGIQRRKEAFAATIQMARPSQPEEIADVVLFLASSMSSCVTRVTIPVDGGVTAK